MGVLSDIFSHRIDHGNGAHFDMLIESGSKPEQYGAGTEVDLQSEPDRYPGREDYAIQPTLFEGASPPSSTKSHQWEPSWDFDPARRTTSSDASQDTQDKEHWQSRWNLRNMFRDYVSEQAVPDDSKQQFLGSAQTALGQMPKGAISALSGSLKRIGVHPDVSSVVKKANQMMHSRRVSRGDEPLDLKPPNSSFTPGGLAFYDPVEQVVHLPMSTPSGPQQPDWMTDPRESQRLIKADSTPITELYLHELAHAIDRKQTTEEQDAEMPSYQREGSDKRLAPNTKARHLHSDDWKWIWAWKKELRDGKLSEYATNNPREGFSEFARLAWTQPDVAASHFPNAYHYFLQHDLVNESSHHRYEEPDSDEYLRRYIEISG